MTGNHDKTPLYRLEKVSHDFQIGKNSVHALKCLDLDIPEGHWFALVGRSGSGKTTLLQMLGGLNHPTAGRILYRGEDLGRLSSRRMTSLRRREFGFVFQSYHLLPELTALENAALPALGWLEDRKAAYERAEWLLESFGLKERLTHRPQELSGGEQQRVAIARALVNNPSVIIADEPTGNLDPARSLEIMMLLEQINALGTTVLVVTHERELVNRFTKRVVAINEGRIISDGMDGYYLNEEE